LNPYEMSLVGRTVSLPCLDTVQNVLNYLSSCGGMPVIEVYALSTYAPSHVEFAFVD